jgi:hypothetical protein
LTPQQIVQKIMPAPQPTTRPTSRLWLKGDPLRPISGKYYGYLIRAASY